MNHGNHTNIEINQLIMDGKVSFGDTVFSTDWQEILSYDGVVFKSICSCRYVGAYPTCIINENPIGICPSPLAIYGSFQDEPHP